MRIPTIVKPLTDFDLRLLRIFVAVVEHGGFSLTQDGQLVYRGVINLFDSLNHFSSLVGTLSKELSGELVILCADQIDSQKQEKLAQIIERVHDSAPNLHIVLDGDSISNIERLLLKDKAHIGIIPEYQRIEGLDYTLLSSEPIYLCCSCKHPFFEKTDAQISDSELALVATIHPGIDIDSAGRKQLEQLNLNAKSYQFDTRKTMIMSGKYLGYMPQRYIQQELNTNNIRIIQAKTRSYQFNLSLVSKTSAREAKKVNLLRNAFNSVFNLGEKA